MKVVFATKNEGKVREIREMLEGTGIEVVSLNAYPKTPEIIEDGSSYLENALIKAKIISSFTGKMVLADDSGLEVDVLDGEPGIYSARYAGEGATDEDNNNKLVEKLKGVAQEKRTAAFHCALVLYRPDGRYKAFEARWPGMIIDEGKGDNGFGYDPIFYIPDRQKTAAQLPPEIKNVISHRGQAFEKLKRYLKEQQKPSG